MTEQKILSIVGALIRATYEHGAPNRFSPGELAALYGAALPPREIGRLAPDVMWAMYTRGWKVVYRERHFHVERTGEGFSA